MSYTKAPTLIARRGYSDLGALSSSDALTLCKSRWPCASSDQLSSCAVAVANEGRITTADASQMDSITGGCTGSGAASGGASTLDKIGSFLGATIGGITKFGQPASTNPLILPQSSTPSWLVPVAIGGIGLVAIMMLGGGRRSSPATAAPTSNPGRRRRSRRSRRR